MMKGGGVQWVLVVDHGRHSCLLGRALSEFSGNVPTSRSVSIQWHLNESVVVVPFSQKQEQRQIHFLNVLECMCERISD